ncbi:MAG TPA: GntR family transcriptional regulator [Clostridia bacterium]
MGYSFDGNTPIYLQLVQIFRQNIVTGVWPPGGRVDSVRELAIQYGVNPNTVQRSLMELERDTLLYAERTSGRFITSDAQLIRKTRDQLADDQIRQFLLQMKSLGYDKSQLTKLVTEKWSEQNGLD